MGRFTCIGMLCAWEANLCCSFCIVSKARGERTGAQNEGEMRKGEGRKEIPYSPSPIPLPLISLSHKLFLFVFVCLLFFFSHPAPVLESPGNFLGPNPNINEY